MFDSVPDGARQFAGRNIDEIYSDYFRRIREIAASGLVDCLSHLDLVKIHGHRPMHANRELGGRNAGFDSPRAVSRSSSRPPAGANR